MEAELPETGGVITAVAFELPAVDQARAAVRIPRRIRRRFLEPRGGSHPPPSTQEEIEAKLREADTRRQLVILPLMEVERAFVGSGCNRIVNNISWGASGLVAFGAQNAVAIFCPQSAQILTTLPGHKANVNCTQWLPTSKDVFKAQQQDGHYLLSGSADGVIMVRAVFIKEKKWKHVMQVPATHKKGVTCLTGMMLSQSVAILASTSSDGIVNVWELVFPSSIHGDEVSYQLIAKHEAHKRIIWSCSWNPHGHQFATGSRDKTVKLWTIEESTSSIKQLATLPPFKESVTALSWAKGLVAVGMDNGLIELWSLSNNLGFDDILALRLDPFLCHASSVHQLAWRTKTVEVNDESGTMELASCGQITVLEYSKYI